MTNEEAIRVINVAKAECEWNAPLEYQEAFDAAIEALMEQSKHDQNTSSKQPDLDTLGIKAEETCEDAISRQDAIDALTALEEPAPTARHLSAIYDCEDAIKALPSAQPEPLSDAYMKAVWTWLLDYQIKAAELKGKYTPYEVLSWVANDWRKEHERSNRQTDGD